MKPVNPDVNNESVDSNDDTENGEKMDGCEIQRGRNKEK